MFPRQNLQKFLLQRCKHLSTHEESRSRDMSEGLVSASFSYVCTCCNSLSLRQDSATRLRYMPLCVYRTRICRCYVFPRHVPETWPFVWANLNRSQKKSQCVKNNSHNQSYFLFFTRCDVIIDIDVEIDPWSVTVPTHGKCNLFVKYKRWETTKIVERITDVSSWSHSCCGKWCEHDNDGSDDGGDDHDVQMLHGDSIWWWRWW